MIETLQHSIPWLYDFDQVVPHPIEASFRVQFPASSSPPGPFRLLMSKARPYSDIGARFRLMTEEAFNPSMSSSREEKATLSGVDEDILAHARDVRSTDAPSPNPTDALKTEQDDKDVKMAKGEDDIFAGQNPGRVEEMKWWMKFRDLDREDIRAALTLEWMARGMHLEQKPPSVKEQVKKFESLTGSGGESTSASALAAGFVLADASMSGDMRKRVDENAARRNKAVRRVVLVRRARMLYREGKVEEAEALHLKIEDDDY